MKPILRFGLKIQNLGHDGICDLSKSVAPGEVLGLSIDDLAQIISVLKFWSFE